MANEQGGIDMAFSEEMEMYLEVSRIDKLNFATQMEAAMRSGKTLSGRQQTALKRVISGKVTESVIRNHLHEHGVRVSRTQVHVVGVPGKPIDLICPKSNVDASKDPFKPEEVDTVVEITNTGVSDKSGTIRTKFNNINNVTEKVRFCVIVLSEKDSYTNTVEEQKLGTDFGCRVFTLLGRERYINPFEWSEKMIMEEYSRRMINGERAIRETGDWAKALDFLMQGTSLSARAKVRN
jgi:hypothetical protein